MKNLSEPRELGRILMRPVCEQCHHVFELDEVYLMSIDCSDSKYNYEHPTVVPVHCPNCKTYFECIEFPIQWIHDFKHNVYREELRVND